MIFDRSLSNSTLLRILVVLNNWWSLILMFYIDLRPGQTCHSKDGESAYSIGGDELGWRCGTGLKSHGTLTNWCTGREWPVNCMTVISAWWRSNMPFQGRRKWHIPMTNHGEILSGRLNYYITRWRQEVSLVWRPDQLRTRCGRESQHPANGAPGPPVEQPWRTGKKRGYGHKSGGQYVAILFGLQLPLTHNTFK